jgi:hypothetical protein
MVVTGTASTRAVGVEQVRVVDDDAALASPEPAGHGEVDRQRHRVGHRR